MYKHKEFLEDYIGNQYERKNIYLKELVELETKIELEKDETTKQKLVSEKNTFIQNKNNHPYQKELSKFREEESSFSQSLKQEVNTYKASLSSIQFKRLKDYKLQLFSAKKRSDFYKKYVDLCYDAELEYKSAETIVAELPEIIHHLELNISELDKAKDYIKGLSITEQDKKSVSDLKQKCKNEYNQKIAELKQKVKDGVISSKAYDNLKKQAQQQMKTDIVIKTYEIPRKAAEENIKHKEYEVKKVSKQKYIVLEDNLSNIRRKTPEETESTTTLNVDLTTPIPGIGQFMNKQYDKAFLFFLGSLFIYLLAIPYMLGYGNYQGQGIYGLITLASEASRISKSTTFMIEGIIAMALLLISAGIVAMSYVDMHTVKKDALKGIRPKNWFETKRNLTEDSFPYLVITPAAIVTIFIVIVPIATSVLLSFTNMNPQNQSKYTWIGLDNYMMILQGQGLAGSVFWKIFGWTIIWTVVATSLAIGLGFFLALITNNDRIKCKAVFRGIFLLPWAVPAFITIMFFSIMLSKEGILTQIISTALGGIEVDVKNNGTVTRIVLICLQGWLGSSYVFLLSTGVLQAISAELYEAADIDGATGIQKLSKITLPIVLFQTAPLLVGQYTFNFNNFSLIYLFNGGGPFNPVEYGNLAGSTDILISYIYKLSMENQQQAIGCAITIIISLGLMTFAYLGFKNSKAFKEDSL